MSESSVTIIVYTDGASSFNPGPAGIGVYLRSGKYHRIISEYLGETTNNIAELTAIYKALSHIKNKNAHIEIYTDSNYSINVLQGNWKVKANKDLVTRIKEKLAEFSDVVFVKVEGHAGIPENELVDKLAVRAVKLKDNLDEYVANFEEAQNLLVSRK